jgi:hypothetical protein
VRCSCVLLPLTFLPVLHLADEGALQELRQADNLVDVAGDVVLKGQVLLRWTATLHFACRHCTMTFGDVAAGRWCGLYAAGSARGGRGVQGRRQPEPGQR